MTYKRIILLLIAVFIIGVAVGILLTLNNDFTYKEASIRTCNYANNITELINVQSSQLETYTGMDYDSLEMLNCNWLG